MNNAAVTRPSALAEPKGESGRRMDVERAVVAPPHRTGARGLVLR